MNTNDPKDMLKDRVLDRIRSGEVSMHSRARSYLRVTALVVVLLLALAVSVLLFTFLFFLIRVNVHDPLLSVGPRTESFFLHFFPWRLLVLDIVLVICAEWLLRKFRFGYRSPTLYLLLAVLAFVLALGLFIDRATRFNDAMYEHAHHRELPWPLNDFYEHSHPMQDTSSVHARLIT